MRLTSDIWAMALVRRAQVANAMAVVVHHGDDQAGAIYVKIARLDGSAALYSPAPRRLTSSAGDDDADGERCFSATFRAGTPEATVDAHMQRQREFDRDLWLIEIEDRQGRNFLDGWLAAEE